MGKYKQTFQLSTNLALAGNNGNMVSGFLAIKYITCYLTGVVLKQKV